MTLTVQIQGKRIFVIPYAGVFLLSHEQVLAIARHTLGDEIVNKYDSRPHVPLVDALEAKGIEHTIFPRYRDRPDGSREPYYCYVFDLYPSFDGKNPQPRGNKAIIEAIWQKVGASAGIPFEETTVQCRKWPQLALPDWYRDRLNKHLWNMQVAQREWKKKQQQSQGTTEISPPTGTQ